MSGLAREMGIPTDGPTELYVDNSGAVELSKDSRSCHRSRHVDRRHFYVRELLIPASACWSQTVRVYYNTLSD